TATTTKSDADGDTVSLAYVWKVNGTVVAGATGPTFDLGLAGHGDKGDTVSVTVTPNDGTLDGAAVADSATIANSAPTAAVTLSPPSPGTNDTLTATATKADADGNAVTLTYVWRVNGSIVRTTNGTSALTDSLDLSAAGNGDRGDTVTVRVIPNDGTVDG